MALPLNALTKINGSANDDPAAPLFVGSDIAGLYGDGALMVIDFADPLGAGGYVGAFAAGDTVINSVAEHVARRTIPGASLASLNPIIAGTYAANQIIIQRTSRGYPHIVVTQTNDADGVGFWFELPDAIKSYIIANPTHQYRVAIEETITRIDSYTGNPGNCEAVIENVNGNTGNLLARLEGRNQGSGGFRPFDTKRIGATMLPDFMSSTGDHFKSIGVNGFSNTVPGSASDLRARWCWGNTDGGGINKARSSVARRFVLEDMTRSAAALAAAVAAGSSTTETQGWSGADARHQAIWNMRRTSTDYYSGDTYNSPSSVLA